MLSIDCFQISRPLGSDHQQTNCTSLLKRLHLMPCGERLGNAEEEILLFTWLMM